MILKHRLGPDITLHNVLHRFWAGHGTGIASLEAKLFQQIISMEEEFLYTILLDLENAYDTLDRESYLGIL